MKETIIMKTGSTRYIVIMKPTREAVKIGMSYYARSSTYCVW